MKKIALLAFALISPIVLVSCVVLTPKGIGIIGPGGVSEPWSPLPANSPNVASVTINNITGNTITFITGETRRFTVDSPRNQRPIHTTATVAQLIAQFPPGSSYVFWRNNQRLTTNAVPAKGDKIVVTSNRLTATYTVLTTEAALAGTLKIHSRIPGILPAVVPIELVLEYTAGQRSPDATVTLQIPAGITITMDNTFVNLIGRGEVSLGGFAALNAGTVAITGDPKTGQTVTFTGLDLRPLNKPDLRIRITGVQLDPVSKRERTLKGGLYIFKAAYTTTEPRELTSPGSHREQVSFSGSEKGVREFVYVPPRQFTRTETPGARTTATFTWTPPPSPAGEAQLLVTTSTDSSSRETWEPVCSVNLADGEARIDGLRPDTRYKAKLRITTGPDSADKKYDRETIPVRFSTGMWDIKNFHPRGPNAKGDGQADDTAAINKAIDWLVLLYGGGIIHFPAGTYNVRTIHLRSNIWLHLDAGATIQCIGNCDAPEATWFHGRDYPAGNPPPAARARGAPDPENYMLKQDMAHRYFQNAMFTAERQDNIKIIGAGRITGGGALAAGDNVMDNPPDRRADKMFSFKLCTNIEIGGLADVAQTAKSADEAQPRPIQNPKSRIENSNMLQIDQGGSIALLATGCDNVHVHDIDFGNHTAANARDLCNFMGCNNVTATNIRSSTSKRAADIIKTGASHALGFTRPAGEITTRNMQQQP